MKNDNINPFIDNALLQNINSITSFHKSFYPTISPVIEKHFQLQNTINRFTDAIKDIRIPDIEFDIDLESTKESIDEYGKFGWTLTPNSDIFYDVSLDDKIDEKIQYDEYFYQAFNKQNSEGKSVFIKDQEYTLDQIQLEFKELLEECYLNYNNGNFKVIIPTLISIIEGQIAILLDTNLFGGRLISKWKDELDESDYTGYLIGYSIVNFLSDSLFVSRKFHEDRLPGLNRNWIMHGRDNPNLWTKVDAMKLFVNLSTILFVKEYAEIED